MQIIRLTLVILAVTCCSTLTPVIFCASLKQQGQQTIQAYQRLLPKQSEKSQNPPMERSPRNFDESLEERLSADASTNEETRTHGPPSSHKKHHLVRESSFPTAATTTTTTTTTTKKPHRQNAKPSKKTRTPRRNAISIPLDERKLRQNVSLAPECYKSRVIIGNKEQGVYASPDASGNSVILTKISLKMDSKNRTVVGIQSAENGHFVCFDKLGRIVSKKLNKRVPSSCQFVELVRNQHVKYLSVKYPVRNFGFDSEGKPYSYCHNKAKCGTHHARRHKKCFKFKSIDKTKRDGIYTKQQITDFVNRQKARGNQTNLSI